MIDAQFFSSAQSIIKQAAPNLLYRPNVVACGLGYKISEGQRTERLSLIVSVTHKVPASQLTVKDMVPKAYDGLVTDVVETGRIRALTIEDPKVRRRPAQPGISIGHYEITAGTFGLLVQRNGDRFILSNNHVLANSNDAKVGDPIYQPGPTDGGTSNDRIATLADFEALDYGSESGTCSIAESVATVINLLAQLAGSSHRLKPVVQTLGINTMDAALAQPDLPELVIPPILGIGIPEGFAEPELGMAVQKMGCTTGLTQGIVTQVNATVNVDYNGRTAQFEDQIFTTRMSNPGDSGSSILDMQNRAVGLLFAGSESVTIFTPIARILQRFNVDLVTSL